MLALSDVTSYDVRSASAWKLVVKWIALHNITLLLLLWKIFFTEEMMKKSVFVVRNWKKMNGKSHDTNCLTCFRYENVSLVHSGGHIYIYMKRRENIFNINAHIYKRVQQVDGIYIQKAASRRLHEKSMCSTCEKFIHMLFYARESYVIQCSQLS